MKVFTAEQMRAFDRAATEEYGIPSIVLMENAALRVVEFLELKFAPLRGNRILILCGKGNNGGDGLAIARHLLNAGCSVTVFLACKHDDLKGDAVINYHALRQVTPARHGIGPLDIFELDFSFDPRESWPFDISLDALLGTGFKGEIRDENICLALRFVAEADVKIAVDIPSGVNADTGEAAPEAVPANYTVTFAAPKRGLFLRDGIDLVGDVWVGAIGTASGQMDETETGCECITAETARALLPYRQFDAHKGDAGRVVVCGGSYGMSGAPTLAARAVLRSGAGLCIACLPYRIVPMFAAAFSEATSKPLPCDDEGQLIESAAELMPGLWKDAHAVALGPGLSRSQGALDFARRVVRECPHPLIVDADALYALRAIEADVQSREAPTILTPHPGEMGELMEMKTARVQEDRIGTALACARKFNAIVVLKGTRSLVALPDGRVFINLTGNSGMATGGSGDVLTGTIAGLLAQLKDAEAATLLGVYVHGLAGDLVAAEKGYGLIAGDLAEALPRALVQLHHDAAEPANARLRQLK